MTPQTRTLSALKAAGGSDAGLQRDVNEDRYYLDPARGIFIVVDGVGGQAAGGKAADIALAVLRSGLARETGTVERRVRDAISAANNEIHRIAALRPEWNGMACVLTAVVIEEGRAIVGHVGDTRLYKMRGGGIQKVTRDHSPVGEREDQGEISEAEAMHHPRRHEVYRDVGSDRHAPADDDFVDLYEIMFEPDAALLLCSDGLTDLVESSAIRQIAAELAGQPRAVVNRLIAAANDAGGKDNVTVVYVEGERFKERATELAGARAEITRRRPSTTWPTDAPVAAREPGENVVEGNSAGKRKGRVALAGLLTFLAAAGVAVTYPYWSVHIGGAVMLPQSNSPMIVVRPTESIAAALQRAESGSQVVVEPGEYRERLVLRSGVLVISRVPRGATLRLPGAASDIDPAVVAAGVSGAGLIGFRIVGDAATPLGTGVLVTDSDVSVMDVEISGAANVAVDVRDGSRLNLVGSAIQSNPGVALALGSGSLPRISHNVFVQNGTSNRVRAPMLIDAGVDAQFSGNVFHGLGGSVFAALGDTARAQLVQRNLFVDGPDPRTRSNALPRGGRGR
jgi:serine/threonine protein phosphatase PrpC